MVIFNNEIAICWTTLFTSKYICNRKVNSIKCKSIVKCSLFVYLSLRSKLNWLRNIINFVFNVLFKNLKNPLTAQMKDKANLFKVLITLNIFIHNFVIKINCDNKTYLSHRFLLVRGNLLIKSPTAAAIHTKISMKFKELSFELGRKRKKSWSRHITFANI